MKKAFDLRIILTVTTGRLLTKRKGPNDNGIGDLYEILEHMTGEPPFTHTLPRFADECKTILLNDYPELEKVDVAILDEMIDELGAENGINNFLRMCTTRWGIKEQYCIGQIPKHVSINPIQELEEMMNK